MSTSILLLTLLLAAPAGDEKEPVSSAVAAPSIAEQKPGTWVRRLAARPMADVGLLPTLSYESAMTYDRRKKVVVMWGGHGLQTDSPQLDETWLYDPSANSWRETAPPRRPIGSCCVRDTAYDEVAERVVQMDAHSGGHGWLFVRHRGVLGLRAGNIWLYDT
ncbi:MAG: Kelch repeat-containing protein, partial [Planctomycetota bacterium]